MEPITPVGSPLHLVLIMAFQLFHSSLVTSLVFESKAIQLPFTVIFPVALSVKTLLGPHSVVDLIQSLVIAYQVEHMEHNVIHSSQCGYASLSSQRRCT